MSFRRVVTPVVSLAVLAAAGTAAFRTQDRWVPHVFPANAASADPHEHDHGGHDHAGHDPGGRPDRVTLSEQAQQNLGLDVDRLTPREYWRTVLIPGVVVDRPGETDRGVTSKVAGVVTAINARPGTTVKAGEPLFTLQLASEFLQSAQTDLARTAKELEFATAERDRVENLVKKGTTPGADLLKQQSVVDRLVTQVNGTRRQLQLFGLTPAQVTTAEKGEIITEVTVPAPPYPAGSRPGPALFEVQELKVHLGDQVAAGQALCVLADHRLLFVEGRAFRSEADALAAAAERRTPVRAEFADETAGAWPAQGPLTIHHLANQVDPATRTFGFYLPLENVPRTFERDGKTHFAWRYRPGQRVRLHLPSEKLVTFAPDGKTEVLPFVLPAGAVAREGGEAFVFVQSGDAFRRQPVRVLYADRSDVVVANDGSVSGVEYVARNQAAALNRAVKAQSAAGGGDHGHSHDH